jgi:DNA-binding response OmpR family regulator
MSDTPKQDDYIAKLVVEDERDIAQLIALHLHHEGYRVTIARDRHAGLRQAFSSTWDLIILDLRLPGPDGIAICKALRADENYVPILMLTAKSSELDRVLGLELGVDDYLTKPCIQAKTRARGKPRRTTARTTFTVLSGRSSRGSTKSAASSSAQPAAAYTTAAR